jgi:hypothetical protein
MVAPTARRKARVSALDTVILALELLKRIPRGRRVTAAQLHEQLADQGFQRDLRSIQRQLEVLSEHFDIERDDRSKPYGYSWKERSPGLSLPGLTPHESLLLALAQQQLAPLLPSAVSRSMDSYFQAARRNIGTPSEATGQRAREARWLAKVRVVSQTQPLLPPKVSSQVFEAVSDALYRDEWLDIRYQKPRETTARPARIMPLGLCQQGPRLFLVCRFDGYEDHRILALHRIQQAEPSGLNFDRPPDFDLDRYIADGKFGFGEGRYVKLSFRITKSAGEHLLETPLSTDQTVEDLGEHYRITATVVESGHLTWWLRGFGEAVDEVCKTEPDADKGSGVSLKRLT